MSKKVITKRAKCCSGCGTESGILTISLPKNVFLRPRTEKENVAWAEKFELKTLTAVDYHTDEQNRRVKLCPECIKPMQKQFGPEDVCFWGRKTEGKK